MSFCKLCGRQSPPLKCFKLLGKMVCEGCYMNVTDGNTIFIPGRRPEGLEGSRLLKYYADNDLKKILKLVAFDVISDNE